MENRYNLVVIGAGPGGYVSAIRAAQEGMKVAVVEDKEVGGTCLNRGCIPTKTLLHATTLYREASHFESIGLNIQGIEYDITKIYERKDDVLAKLRAGIEQLLKANKIDLITGMGVIVSEDTVKVEGNDESKELKTDKILIATGSKPTVPKIEGLDLENVITSDEILSMSDKVYNPLVIIGGGVIGVEFATIYNALGSEVTIIEAMDRILPIMDREISQNLAMILKKRGVKIYTSAMVEKIMDENGLVCYFNRKGKAQNVPAEGILVAIGRKANAEGLFDGQVTLEMDRGNIIVDENFKTSVDNIYAIGDVIGGIQLAHVASAEGITAIESMLGKKKSINLDLVPSCIYTNPEIAAVGLSLDEAKQKGINTKVGKISMMANGKSLIEMQDRGFIKVIFDADTDIIIGAQLMCARATDMISELSTAIANKNTREQLLSVIRPHPTFAEAITEAVDDVEGHAIHNMPKLKRR
jgi:dihydrolipoamide dehydrogenase